MKNRRCVLSRFGNPSIFEVNKLKMEVLNIAKGTFTELFIKEQSILKLHKEFRIKVSYPKFSSYECFSKDVLELKVENDPMINIMEQDIKLRYRL